MALNNLLYFSTLFLLIFVLNSFSVVEPRTIESIAGIEHPFAEILQSLEGVSNGQTAQGIRELKRFLVKFGYLHDRNLDTLTLTDHFDENLESALKDYQKYYQLKVTGRLDAPTIKQMSLPRCGVPDIHFTKHEHKNPSGLSIAANFTFFDGSPKWQDFKRSLTYSFNSGVDVISKDEVRQACANAFQSWSKVSGFTFSEAASGQPADVALGFYSGDHGDGYPFDGAGYVLAHAFAPEDGRLHFDADEGWTTHPNNAANESGIRTRLARDRRPRRPRRPVKKSIIDLETVALHEIGHILGLGHSDNPDSIMFPTYPGVKRELREDDISGIKALYGNN